MKTKIYFLITLLALAMSANAATTDCITLNGKWDFKLMDGAWSTITVPGNWEMQGFGTPVYDRKTRNETAMYKRTFTVPKEWKGKTTYICFEGVQAGFTFSINGKTVGSFASSFNRRTFDVSKFLACGKQNTIEMTITTHPKGYEFDTNDDWSLHGINRDVYLYAVPKAHIEDVTIVAGADFSLKATYSVKGIKNYKIKEEVLYEKRLWTAETPYMNTLRSTLLDAKGKVLHQVDTKFGYRTVEVRDGVFLLNGRPVKLHGVDHHDLSETHGRGMTNEEIRRDLMMMKEANINYIRTAHYPPQPYLLDLCDSLGIYVTDEVPFGFGDEHLNDTTYLPILKERAYYTWKRDKNHPSVLIWTIGNENPFTPMCLKTLEYMQELDPTRFGTFPQTSRPFDQLVNNLPASVKILDKHYPRVGDIRRYTPKLQGRPFLTGEYAHALGLDMGNLEETYDELYHNPMCIGGGVWMFQDQGIMKIADKPIGKHEVTPYTWVDETHYFDTQDILGTDGIVYANRVPQTDYYEVMNVYCPVKVLGSEVVGNRVNVKIENRYDYINLNTVTISWKLMRNGKAVDSGKMYCYAEPHGTTTMSLPCPDAKDAYYYYALTFTDKDNIKIGTESVLLTYYANYGLPTAKATDVKFFTRIGRKPSMTQMHIEKGNGKHKLSHSTDDLSTAVDMAEDGTVAYSMTVQNEFESLECGLSFVLPANITEFRWVGNGPYPSYPNKKTSAKFGIYHLNAADLYLPGNRNDVDIMLLTDKSGAGYAMVMDKGNVAIERTEQGIVVSHNAHVGDVFNKNVWPGKVRKFEKGEVVKGSFKLIPLGNDWASALRDIFGAPNENVKPFTPFYRSYDD